ncbi:AGE2 [Sanghuangporus sanghuang]
MYKQDKATTEKHSRILRELVKHPENKTCADCKRQDARWASWNIGVFICIRCSGVHRSMGTHISKVKSVDLDTWTPEQMESIQKWGNHRANLYWEAHLRPGHVPPEHKLDSFIRSKYESRRWARGGPPPPDPSILEDIPATSDASDPPAPVHIPELSSLPPTSPPRVTSQQPQTHRLLSATVASRAPAAQPGQATVATDPAASKAQNPASELPNDIFSLDFHAPTPTAQQPPAPKKDVKNDILSLFSTSSPNTASVPGSPAAAFGQSGSTQPPSQVQPQSISMIGSSGVAIWGAQSGWTPNAPPAQPNVWGGFQSPGTTSPVLAQQTSIQSIFETQNVWGAASGLGTQGAGGSNDVFGSTLGSSTAPLSTAQKKDDVFGDLWGDFK